MYKNSRPPILKHVFNQDFTKELSHDSQGVLFDFYMNGFLVAYNLFKHRHTLTPSFRKAGYLPEPHFIEDIHQLIKNRKEEKKAKRQQGEQLLLRWPLNYHMQSQLIAAFNLKTSYTIDLVANTQKFNFTMFNYLLDLENENKHTNLAFVAELSFQE